MSSRTSRGRSSTTTCCSLAGHRVTRARPWLDLTASMYDYHNNLRATHAASSPWWAWPLDLKPVWFYAGSFAGDTSAAVYDHGSLVTWWMAVPAIGFVAVAGVQALVAGAGVRGDHCSSACGCRGRGSTGRRSSTTTTRACRSSCSPSRTLVAELWHGASRKTWLFAKAAAAVAVMGPVLLWLFKAPLCVDRRRRPGLPRLAGLRREPWRAGPDHPRRGRRRDHPRDRRDPHLAARPPRPARCRRSLRRDPPAAEHRDHRRSSPGSRSRSSAGSLARACSSPSTASSRRSSRCSSGCPLAAVAWVVLTAKRRASVRDRARPRGDRLDDRALSEHRRPAAPDGRLQRLPGHPADVPLPVPVRRQHRPAGRPSRCRTRWSWCS